MATLLPWNFFITPFAYWMTKLQKADWQNTTTPDVPEQELFTSPIDVTVSIEDLRANATPSGGIYNHMVNVV